MNQDGLFAPPAEPETAPGPIETAAQETIKQLGDEQRVTGRDALTLALIRECAKGVDRGLKLGKVSIATTTLVKELRELIALVNTDESAITDDQLAQLMDELNEGEATNAAGADR